MTADDFAQIEGDLTVTNAAYLEGLINVNTASAQCWPAFQGSERKSPRSL